MNIYKKLHILYVLLNIILSFYCTNKHISCQHFTYLLTYKWAWFSQPENFPVNYL